LKGEDMEVNVIKEIEVAVTTIGFPIFMCWLMWKKITESDAKQSELIAKLTAAIEELSIYIKGRRTDNE
jgi:hypothetical protein